MITPNIAGWAKGKHLGTRQSATTILNPALHLVAQSAVGEISELHNHHQVRPVRRWGFYFRMHRPQGFRPPRTCWRGIGSPRKANSTRHGRAPHIHPGGPRQQTHPFWLHGSVDYPDLPFSCWCIYPCAGRLRPGIEHLFLPPSTMQNITLSLLDPLG